MRATILSKDATRSYVRAVMVNKIARRDALPRRAVQVNHIKVIAVTPLSFCAILKLFIQKEVCRLAEAAMQKKPESGKPYQIMTN